MSPVSMYPIMAFTESWWNYKILSTESGLDDYIVYRCDKSIQTSSLPRSGGVLLAVRNFIPSKPILVSNSNIELLFVHIQIKYQSIVIGLVYIPNRSDENVFNEYFNYIKSIYIKFPYAIFLLLGDFNLPSSKLSNSTSYINNQLSYLDFSQFNSIKNLKNIILDLVMSNSFLIDVDKVDSLLVSVDKLHPPLNIILKCSYNEIYHIIIAFTSGNRVIIDLL